MDTAILEKINGLAPRVGLLTPVMIAIARYGPVLCAIALVWFWLRGRYSEQRGSIVAGIATLLALGLGQLLGLAWPRPRPYERLPVHLLVPRVHDTSFPSDHATLGFAVAVGVLFFHRKAGMWLMAFAIILAYSRVFVGAHYPTDVIAGAALGSLAAVGMNGLFRRDRFRSKLDKVVSPLAQKLSFSRKQGSVDSEVRNEEKQF